MARPSAAKPANKQLPQRNIAKREIAFLRLMN